VIVIQLKKFPRIKMIFPKMNLKTTPYEEWDYIGITLKELISIIISNYTKKIFREKNAPCKDL
jgi:hypothetical protein